MKKYLCVFLCLAVILSFGLFAAASSSENSETVNQGTGKVETKNPESENTVHQVTDKAETEAEQKANLGDYNVEILSCRLAKAYDDRPIVIVKYLFSNYSQEASSFSLAFQDEVYQAGIGLNHSYFVSDSADYSADNQNKNIKPGAQLEVEVAYELNDATTDIEVEVSQLFSWDETVVKKTFVIA